MTDKLETLLTQMERAEQATMAGRRMHALLRRLQINSNDEHTENELLQKISERLDIAEFFSQSAMTEVPIAGKINGKFISRRIDRMLINDASRQIKILDYKTDTDETTLHDKYVAQIGEYIALVRDAYPNYNVRGYILWMHNLTLEEVCVAADKKS